MKIELPRTGAPILNATVYHPKGDIHTTMTADYNFTLEVPNDTYLVIVEAVDTAGKVYGIWGYDRTQWLPYKPEYHNAKRLAPKPKPVKTLKQESMEANSQTDLTVVKPLD